MTTEVEWPRNPPSENPAFDFIFTDSRFAETFRLKLLMGAMSRWLQGYAYRTDIPWWLSAGVIAGVVAVVLFTVLGQVLKAAGSNPGEVVIDE
jgi:putative ABC transport system permease protein